MKLIRKVFYFFFPFLSKDWQGFSGELQKGKLIAQKKQGEMLLRIQSKAFKAGQDLRKKVDPNRKMKLGKK